MRQTPSQKLFALKNDDKTDDYVCLSVDSQTRTKPAWKMQVLLFLNTWTFWAEESGTQKNVPRSTHRSYYLYSTICSYHQDLAPWNIHLSLKSVSIYKKGDVKQKGKCDTYCSVIAASLIYLHWAELLIYIYKIINICQTYFCCHPAIEEV